VSHTLRLVGRRLLQLPLMILGITFLVFFVMSFSPVDPARTALGETASPEALEAYREDHGLNLPLFVRYVNFLFGLVQGDLGTYSARSLPVVDEVARAFPVTLALTFLGLVIAVVVAFVIGVLAALGVLPASGPLPAFADDPSGWLARMTLPAVALAVPVIGQLSRVVRTSMVEELDRDYVRTALGAGIPRVIVVGRNVLRNALITPVTVLGLRIGYLLGGAVVIEIIFAIPGMGTLILNGVTNNEPNLVQGVTLAVALAFVVINIIVDLLYVLINPRIRAV